jgi:hypothetical protein
VLGDLAEATERRLERSVRAGFRAGLLATLAATGWLALAPRLGLGDAIALLGALHLGVPPLVATAAHLGYGAFAGALFAAAAVRSSTGSALAFALALLGVALFVYAPLVGVGPGDPRAAPLFAALLPAHLLYGAVLGGALATAPSRAAGAAADPAAPPAPPPARRAEDRSA